MTSTILDELLKIEKRLQVEGDTDRLRKEFWRLVGRIKRLDRSEVDDETLEKATAIRNRLFKKRVILSVEKGLPLFLTGWIVSFALFVYINLYASLDFLYMATLLFITGVMVVYFGHPVGRYLGGLIGKIRFDGFYRYSPGELGLKIEYTSYLKSGQRGRILLFGTSVFWTISMILVQLVIVLSFNPDGLPVPIILLIMMVLALTIGHYAKKTGELHRLLREVRIARESKRKAE